VAGWVGPVLATGLSVLEVPAGGVWGVVVAV
jgi:hypothetical protein